VRERERERERERWFRENAPRGHHSNNDRQSFEKLIKSISNKIFTYHFQISRIVKILPEE
jgi:hypothetical protein